jgi:hypothetical protein
MAHVKQQYYGDILAYNGLLLSVCAIGYQERGVKNCEWQNPKRTRTNRDLLSTRSGVAGKRLRWFADTTPHFSIGGFD